MKLSDLPPKLRATVARQLQPTQTPVTRTDAGRQSMTIALPWPPSVNKLWYHKGNRRHCTPEYTAYKKTAALAALAALACGATPYYGLIDLWVTLYFPKNGGDVDNREKAIYDAMKGILWVDDKQLNERNVEPVESPNPRVVISIFPGAVRRLEGTKP